MGEYGMKLYNTLTVSLLAGILLTGVGCSMFDSQTQAKKTAPPVTEEIVKPLRWEKNIEIESMGGLTKDGWQPIENVTLPTIYFAYDRSTIGSSERHKLEQVAKYMKENTTFGLIIEGHCDEKGSAEYNRSLGERRAIIVRDYLVNSGVDVKRIKTMSYGEDRLAHKADNEVAHAKNRRAELILARTR
jgi:outer membrane protein OmpA-like peptidoglycan-associated protein